MCVPTRRGGGGGGILYSRLKTNNLFHIISLYVHDTPVQENVEKIYCLQNLSCLEIKSFRNKINFWGRIKLFFYVLCINLCKIAQWGLISLHYFKSINIHLLSVLNWLHRNFQIQGQPLKMRIQRRLSGFYSVFILTFQVCPTVNAFFS